MVRKQHLERHVHWVGLSAFGVFALGAAATAHGYVGPDGTGYSMLWDTISTLGNPYKSARSSVFNAAMVVTGLCLAFFTAGVCHLLGTRIAYCMAAMGLLGGFATALVGVFPAGIMYTQHFIVAGIGFLSLVGLGAFGTLYFLVTPQPLLPRWQIVPAAMTFVLGAAFLGVLVLYAAGVLDRSAMRFDLWAGGPRMRLVPLMEWAAFLSILMWTLLTACTLWARQVRLGRARSASPAAAS